MSHSEHCSHVDDPWSKMECGVCHTVYDPAEGDARGRAAPGTPFAALPADWNCPICNAPASKFMKPGCDHGHGH